MTELLKQNIAKHISLSSSEFDKFNEAFKLKTIKKKQFYLREGEICKYEAFVSKGLFKIYYLDTNGFENILNFATNDWWLGDIDSFSNKTPSKLFIEVWKIVNYLSLINTTKKNYMRSCLKWKNSFA